ADGCYVGHVGIEDDVGPRLLGERNGAATEGFALVGEGELGAMTGQHAGDAPRNRTLIGNPHDEAALACHQRPGPGNVCASHDFLPFVVCASHLAQPLTMRRLATPANPAPRIPAALPSRFAP